VNWIDQLGHPEFEVRDKATSQLSNLSADHLPVLRERLGTATDPEVRVRLSGVVAKLKYERQQNIVKAFLRDPDMANSHELDGWQSFSAVAGANRSSKRLFLQLYERHPGLVERPLESVASAMESARRVSRSIQENEIQLGEGDPADGLALLYCLCVADASGDNQLATMALRVFMRFPYNQFFRDPQAKKPMEVMVERWALSLRGGGDLTSAMLIMIESELTTVRSVARKMLEVREGPERAEPDDLLIAMQMMFRYGTKDDLPVLERWLDSTEVCVEIDALNFGGGVPDRSMPPIEPPLREDDSNGVPVRMTYSAQVRDVAVLACMRIAGMEYREYFPSILLQEPRGYLARSIVSPPSDDGLRQARIDAWRASISEPNTDQKN
jgi:hypothetical protein